MFQRLLTYAKVLPPDFKQRILFIFPGNRIVHLPLQHFGKTTLPHSQLSVLPPKELDLYYRFDEEIERTTYEAKDFALANTTKKAEEYFSKIQALLSSSAHTPLIKDRTTKALIEADVLTARAFLTSNGLEKSIQLMNQAVSIKRMLCGMTELSDITQEKALMYLQYGKLSEAEAILSKLFKESNQDLITSRNIRTMQIGLNLSSTRLLLDPSDGRKETNKLLQECRQICHHENYSLIYDMITHNLSLLNKPLSTSHTHCLFDHLPAFPKPWNRTVPAFR